jgi:hypothetical protein
MIARASGHGAGAARRGLHAAYLGTLSDDLQLASGSVCEWTTRGSVPTATVRDVELFSGPILNRLRPIPREVFWVVALALTGLLVGQHAPLLSAY